MRRRLVIIRATLGLLLLLPAVAVAASPAAASPSPLQAGPDSLALLAVQQAELSGPSDFGDFGFSVALAGDTALVGEDSRNVAGHRDVGAVYVYVRSGTTWTQQAELTPSDAATGDGFGSAVALDGDTALVGADGVDTNAYVFTRSGTTWTQAAELPDPEASGDDLYGWSVALDGDTALIGAPGDLAAFVFTRSGANWALQATLSDPRASRDNCFGAAVALSGDEALVGDADHTVAGYGGAGAAFLFTRSGANWTRQAVLTDPDAAVSDDFGFAVALSGDEAVVGEDERTVAGRGWAGAAYVFTGSGTSWQRVAELHASDVAAGAMFGSSIALCGDEVLIGADWNDLFGPPGTGAAYLFSGSGASWSPPAELHASDAAYGALFGCSVALCGDTALIGAFAGGKVGGKAYAELLSTLPTAPPALSLRAAPQAVNVGGSIVVSGEVTNFVATQGTVGIWSRLGARRPVFESLTLTAAGTFRWRVLLTKAGTWGFVAAYQLGGVTSYASAPVIVKAHK